MSDKLADGDIVVGYPEEWRLFWNANQEFHAVLPRVFEAVNLAFSRTFTPSDLAGKVVFQLGALCVEDLDEIVVLAGNGRGFGCQKILRGMFERLVTAKFIHENPAEAEKFIDFYSISGYKLAVSMHGTFGDQLFSEEVMEERRRLRDEHREKFKVRCTVSGCDKMRDGISWTALDVVSIAARVGLKDIVSMAYYLPMTETHATLSAVISRLDGDGKLTMHDSQRKARDIASPAVMMAHWLTLVNLEVQQKQYLEIAEVLGGMMPALEKDFHAAWAKPSPEVQ